MSNRAPAGAGFTVGGGAIGTFALIVVAELLFGAAVGWLFLRMRHRARDPQVEITLSLLTPYLAFWIPHHFGGSGVIATVACGLYMSWNGPLLISSATRLQGIFFWDLVIYLIEGLLFLLTGFQMRLLYEWGREGATLYFPHGMYYADRALWWEWAPPDLGWNQPHSRHYPAYAETVGRLMACLSAGRHVPEVGVLFPQTTVWADTQGTRRWGEAALRADETYVALFGMHSVPSGWELERADRPTGVVAMSDELAAGVVDAATARGIEVPGDLSVVGFDDTPTATSTAPPLTTIHQPLAARGETAARLLLEGAPARFVEFPTELVVRCSTTRAPA